MTAPADTPAEKSTRTGPITRARASMAALEVLDTLREQRRNATDQEREVLRQWAGWGPMANAFEPDRTAAWAEIGERVEWLLPPEDQIEARKATPNAFYTPPEITEVCWSILRELGFDGGRILEPGCGAGVFMGHTPDDLSGEVSWLGIERDPSTAAIAQAIYPDAEIINSKLEKSKLPTASVDAVLGNVPFANTLIFDPNAPQAVTKNLHNYCIWRSAQSLRPGGIAVLITSRYTMDSVDREAREALYANCDLISAVRLPNVAWRSGGTEPVADILVLRRRRPGEEPGDDTWLDAEKVDSLDTEVNRLFLARPDLVIGEHARDRAAQYGRVMRVDLPEDADWAAELRSKVEPLAQEALGRGLFWNVDAAPEPISAENTVLADAEGRKEGSFHLVGGKAHEVRDGLLRPVTKRQKVKGSQDDYEDVPLKGKELAEITALIGLRDTTVGVLESEERAVEQEKAIRDADDALREQHRELARHEAALRTAMKAEPDADLPTLLFTAQHPTWDAEPDVLAQARASAQALQSAHQQRAAAEHTRVRATAVLGEITTELGGLRAELNNRYDDYQRKYGFLNRCTIVEGKPDEETGQVTIQRRRPRMGGFRTDPDYFSVLALEDWDDDTRSASKAAIFSRRVNRAPQRRERADNVGEAIALCLDEHGSLHLPTVARLLDIEVAAVPEAMGDLAFVDPATGAWCTAEEYLAGNVRTKLDQALAAAETEPDLWTRNIDALREVQPVELGPGEIHAPLGAPWIPSSDVRDFLVELLGTNRSTMVRREPLTSTWEVKIDKRDKSTPEATAEWGTERVHAAKLVELALNGQTPEVKDTVKLPDGTKETVRNIEATTAAEEKQRQVMARFLEWVWEEPERADRLAERYNKLFNSTVLRRYDGAHLSFPGLAEGFDPYPHQRDMVYQAISTQTALCGHAVGGGKTTIMFMTAMKLRQLGLVNKPMITVPKHLLEQTAREGKQRFPGAKILVADENDMSDARSRKLFAARCATGDWDAVIVTHPAFTRIPMHERNEADYLSELAAKYRASLAAVVASEDADDDEFSKSGRRTKQVEKLIDSLESRVEYLLEHAHDDGVRFEHLGVDHLLVDEFHYFKNLMVPCHTEGFSMSSSKRATDMDMKLTWLRSRYDRVGTFYTGTAVSNTLLELYIVLHYLCPERLEELGIDSPDAWAAWCVQFETNVEIGPDGVTPRLNRRPSTFKNVRELLQLFAERSDIRTQEDLGLKVPEVSFENRVSKATRVQRAGITNIARRADMLKHTRPQKGADNMLKICTDGRKFAVAAELLGLVDPEPTKVDDLIDNAAQIFHETADLQFPADSKHAADAETGVRGGFQIVFCDLGTPSKERGDQVYGKIRDGLIAQGVPRDRIRFIHDAGTDAAKAKLFADCRSGKISVLIGSTDKLGVGTNIQSRAVTLHHLDAPWKPAEVEQREGRVRRPGNRMLALQQERARRLAAGEEIPANWPEKVRIIRYVTEGSFDGFMWQGLERKARFIAQVLSGKLAAGQREIDDIGEVTLSFAEVKALATGNPLLMDLAKVKADVARLSSLAASHTRTQKRLTNNIARDQREIRDNDTLAKALEGVAKTVEQAVQAARVAQVPPEEQGSLDGQNPDAAEDREVVTPWATADGKTLAEDKDIDTALAALAQHTMKTKRHSETWLTWRGLRIGFELKDQGWRQQVLSAVINTGSSPHPGTHRVEVNAKWLAKGQQYRFRTAVVGAVESAAVRAADLRETNEQLTKRIESSRGQLGKPFAQTGEFNTARARLEEINTELRKSTEPKKEETAAPVDRVIEPDADADFELDDAAVDAEFEAMVMHDAEAMAGLLGDDVQVMVDARNAPPSYTSPQARAYYRDAAEADNELSDLTAQLIGLPEGYPGHSQAVASLVRAKLLHQFALTVDENLDGSVQVPVPGLGMSTSVSGAGVAGAFGALAEAAVRGERSGHVVWRGLRVEIGHRHGQLMAALSIEGDPEYPKPGSFQDVPLEESWAAPDQHWQILRALDRFVGGAADRARVERRRVSHLLGEHRAAAGLWRAVTRETSADTSTEAEPFEGARTEQAIELAEHPTQQGAEPADDVIDELTAAVMETTDLADRLHHLAKDEPANKAFSKRGLAILHEAAVPLGIAFAADRAPDLTATRSGPPAAQVPTDTVDQVLAEVARQAIRDPRSAEHVLWRGLRIEFGIHDSALIAAVSRIDDKNFSSPVYSDGANFLPVPLEMHWATTQAEHSRIRAAIENLVGAAPEQARAGREQVAALLAEHAAAARSAVVEPPLAEEELGELLGLTPQQAQWLHRQFVALAQNIDVRDAERTVPEAMPQFFRGALDLKLAQPIRAEREQADPVGLEVARRYTDDRPFATQVREIGIDLVRTMVNRDLDAGLPTLVNNLFADLALPHTEQDAAWIRQWITDAAADPRMVQVARVNTEINFAQVLNDYLLDAVAEAMDGDNPPTKTVLDYLLGTDEYLSQRWRDLARGVIYASVHDRDTVSPGEPADQPAPAPAATEPVTPVADTPQLDALESDAADPGEDDQAAALVPADVPAAEPETSAPSTDARDGELPVRTLTFHYSFDRGVMLLGTDRRDGIADLLRPDRAGWKWRQVETPTGESGAWLLPKTLRVRRDAQSMNKFHQRLIARLSGAGNRLIRAGFAVQLDLHDLPETTSRELQAWASRTQAAVAQPEPATTQVSSDSAPRIETAPATEVASALLDDEPGQEIPASGGSSLAPEVLTLLAEHGWVHSGFVFENGRLPAQGALPAPGPESYTSEWQRKQQRMRIEWTSAGEVIELRLNGREVPLTFTALGAALTALEPAKTPDPAPDITPEQADPEPQAPAASDDLNRELRALYDEMSVELAAAGYTHRRSDTVAQQGTDHASRTVTTDRLLPFAQEMTALADLVDEVRTRRHELEESTERQYADALRSGLDGNAAARASDLLTRAGELDALARRTATASRSEQPFVIPRESGFMARQLNDGDLAPTLLGFARAAQRKVSPQSVLGGLIPADYLTWRGAKVSFKATDAGVQIQLACADEGGFDTIAVPDEWLGREDGGQLLVDAVTGAVGSAARRADKMRTELAELLGADDRADALENAPQQAAATTTTEAELPTLRELRAMAAVHDLQARVVRVGDAAFVAVHEPAAPNPPVLSWPLGSGQAFDGAGRPMPVESAAEHLATYRATVPAELIAAEPGLTDWARRVAQLTPHMLPGPERRPAVRHHVDLALALAGDDPVESENLLRRAEDVAGPLTLTPEREARVVREIHDQASGYTWAGDIGRYLTEPGHLDGTRQEWDWINAYVAAHPEVTKGNPDHNGIRTRNAAERAEQEKLGAALSSEASAAYRAGAFDSALDLLDRAELAFPGNLARWNHARNVVTEAMRAAQPTPSTTVAAEETAPEESVAEESVAEQGALIDAAALGSTGPSRSRPRSRSAEPSPVLGAEGLEVWQAFHRTAAEGTEPPATSIPRRRIDGEIVVRPGYRRVVTDAGWPPPGERTGPRGPLTHADIAMALLRIASFAPSAFRNTVARVDEPGEWAQYFLQGHQATRRGENEPDAGETDRVVAWGGHVEIELGHLRAGAVLWHELAAWLRPGLSEEHAEFFAQDVPVWRKFPKPNRSMLSSWTSAADTELLQVFGTVVAEVLTRALRAHLTPAGQEVPAVPSVLAQARERVAALTQAAPTEAEPTPTEQPDGAEQSDETEQAPVAADEPEQGLPTAAEQAAEPALIAPQHQIELYARINAEAARWFDEQLDASPAEQQYLRDRIGTQADVDRVRHGAGAVGGLSIGFAPRGWTGLVEHLRTKGFRDQDLVDAGVASVVRSGPRQGQLIDRFRNRIMFGIRDREGRMAGFIGRDRSGTSDAKYLNSHASPLFDKSSLLLGLYEQRDLAGHAVPVFVEGPFDVAALMAAARPDRPLMPITPCGTALTTGHLDAVDELVPADRRRVFALDGDEAGQKAGLASAETAIHRYEDVDVTTLPDGLDPAEFALTVGVDEQIAAYLGQPYTRPAMDVLVDARLELWAEHLQWIEGRVGAARNVAALLAAVEPQRIADLAVRVATRLEIDPEYMAEYIAEARNERDDLPPVQPPTLSRPIATSGHDRRDERPGAAAAAQTVADTDVTAAPEPPELETGSADARDDARPAELDAPQQPAQSRPIQQPDEADVAAQPEPEATEPAPGREVAVAPEPDTPAPENRGARTADQPATEPAATSAVASMPAQPGPWTRRIEIEVTGTTAVVSGTSGGDPKVLRQALKDNGFRWRPQEGQVWKFFRRHGGPSRDAAVQSIRDVLTDLDDKEAAKASPAPSYPPTPQQGAIMDACVDGLDVAVRALAGTGKTSTMRMVADRMPDKQITLITFNRSIADEAQATFGRNVRADTMHAFARQALRSNPRYQAKLGNVARNDGFPQEIAAVLGLKEDDEFYYRDSHGLQRIDAMSVVRMAVGAVKRFRESADAEVGPQHVGADFDQDATSLDTLVLNNARLIWADKVSPTGQLRFTHDDYLKIWALGNPTIPGDVIIFDEVQDVNELQARLVQAQDAQTIVVGDSFQSIYGFRGAKDFLRSWPADVTLPLTKSWRFGPVVADTGNRFLGLLRSTLVLEGNDALDTRLERVENPDAVLCRTNAGAVAAVFAGIEDGKRVALVGGGDAIKEIARAAKDLQRGRRTKHPDLSMFASWHDVRDYVNQHEDAQSLKMFVRLVDQHQPDGLIAMADELVDEDQTDPDLKADLVVSTAHKAKGREWNNVRIADDFRAPTEDPETGEKILPSPEELRLSYVTVTRAQRRLELGSLEWVLEYDVPEAAQALAAPVVQQQAQQDAEVVQQLPEPGPVAEPVLAERESVEQTLVDQVTGNDDLVESSAVADIEDTVIERNDPGLPAADDRLTPDPVLWGWQEVTWEEGRDGSVFEEWRRSSGTRTTTLFRVRNEFSLFLPQVLYGPDGLIESRDTSATLEFDSIDTVQQVLAEAGRCGWAQPGPEPGQWQVTTTTTAAEARAAVDADDARREVRLRTDDDTWVLVATGEPMLAPPQPAAGTELAPAQAQQQTLETAVVLPEQVAQAETETASAEQPAGPFPIELLAGDLDSRDALLRRVRERLERLPREIGGVPTGPVHLALAVTGSALTTVDAFPALTTALRITGNDQSPLLTAHRISQFADLVDEAIPDLTAQRNALGYYQDDRSLAGHLRAISTEIGRIAGDPVSLARARAATLFNTFTVTAVRSVHQAVTVGDVEAVNEFFGATSHRGRLIEPAALQVLRDAFVAQATRTRFEPGSRGQAEVEQGHGLDTGIALQALAVEARNRARFADGTGRVLRAAGIASIADDLDAVAGSMAAAGNFVLPEEISAEPQDADLPGTGEASTEQASTGQASDRPNPLVPYDVAFMLRNMAGWEFARLVRSIGDGEVVFARGGEGGQQRSRGENEPDPGAPVHVRYNAKAVVIEVGAAEQPRAGRITWKRLQDWIAAGLTPATRQVLLDADDAHSAFVAAGKGFIAIGERDLAQAAREELGGYRDEVITAIVDAALAEHEKAGGRTRRRRATVEADTLIAVGGLTDMSDEQRSVLDRITALTTVLPADAESHKPLSQIEVGDVVEHPGYSFEPYRITQQPVVHENHVELTGDLLDYRRNADGPTIWQFSTTGESDPQLRTVPRPQSLERLMAQADEAPGRPPASPAAAEIERIQVPEDLDLADFGWERIDLSYNEYGPVERWARGSTELTLGWESTDDDLLLATPIVLNGREHPISSIEEFQVVLVEAGQHGFARPNGNRWAVTATPTAAFAHDVVDGGELLRLVTLDARQGWVFVDSGEAVELADPPAAPRSRPPAPARPATTAPADEQFSLFDDAVEEPQTTAARHEPEADPAAPSPAAEPIPDSVLAEEVEKHTADGPHPDPAMKWTELVDLAKTLGFTVVKTQSATQVITDHDLRTIAVPWDTESTRSTDLLFDELARLTGLASSQPEPPADEHGERQAEPDTPPEPLPANEPVATAAADEIDWSRPGTDVHPLQPATLARIDAGLKKYAEQQHTIEPDPQPEPEQQPVVDEHAESALVLDGAPEPDQVSQPAADVLDPVAEPAVVSDVGQDPVSVVPGGDDDTADLLGDAVGGDDGHVEDAYPEDGRESPRDSVADLWAAEADLESAFDLAPAETGAAAQDAEEVPAKQQETSPPADGVVAPNVEVMVNAQHLPPAYTPAQARPLYQDAAQAENDLSELDDLVIDLPVDYPGQWQAVKRLLHARLLHEFALTVDEHLDGSVQPLTHGRGMSTTVSGSGVAGAFGALAEAAVRGERERGHVVWRGLRVEMYHLDEQLTAVLSIEGDPEYPNPDSFQDVPLEQGWVEPDQHWQILQALDQFAGSAADRARVERGSVRLLLEEDRSAAELWQAATRESSADPSVQADLESAADPAPIDSAGAEAKDKASGAEPTVISDVGQDPVSVVPGGDDDTADLLGDAVGGDDGHVEDAYLEDSPRDSVADLWAAEADLESAFDLAPAETGSAAQDADEAPATNTPFTEDEVSTEDARLEDASQSAGELRTGPAVPVPIDPVAQQWSALVAQAAELGFVVQTRYAGESGVDLDTRTIHVAFDQAPHTRVVDLAMKLVEVAVQRTPVEAVAADTLARQRSEETAPAEPTPVANEVTRPTPVTADDEPGWTPTTGTPIYERLRWELGLTDTVEHNEHTPSADGGTREEDLDTPLFAAVRREFGLVDAVAETNGHPEPDRDVGDTPHEGTSARSEVSGQGDIHERAGGSAEAAVETPARKERTGLPGARPVTTGGGVARTTGDPVGTSRSRHNR